MSDHIGTPKPRGVIQTNAKFILIVAGFIIVSIFVVGFFSVFRFGERQNESLDAKTLARAGGAELSGRAVETKPLIDFSQVKKPEPKTPSPPIPVTSIPSIPPPLPPPSISQQAVYIPPPPSPQQQAVNTIPKQPWHKPEMPQGSGSARGGTSSPGSEGGGGPSQVPQIGGGGGYRRNVSGVGGNQGGGYESYDGSPRDGREAFAAAYGQNNPLYHNRGELPALKGCVGKVGSVVNVETTGVVKTAIPGQFTMRVVRPLQGKIFDPDAIAPCENPLIPAGSTVTCSGNTVDVQRGDKAVQVVCSRIDFPFGGTLPLNGFPLVAADGSNGVTAEAQYNWGEIAAAIAIDIVSVIPGAVVTGLLSRGGTVILNGAGQAGAQSTQQAAQTFSQSAFNRKPVLTIPAAAKAGLFFPVDVSLRDAMR